MVAWLSLAVSIGLAVHVSGRRRALRQADVIIVLGSGVNRDGSAGPTVTRRAGEAATLWKAGLAPMVLCSGGYTSGYPKSEAAACRDVLLQEGVAGAAIHLEDRSHDTGENALFSHPIVQARGWRHALLVTDSFHMLRASVIFSRRGIPHQRAPVAADAIPRGWYLNRLGREVIALQWQAVKELLPFAARADPWRRGSGGQGAP
jgi:uncharacterized SAM-binding protein YcdF (DUF218 family)